MPLVRKTRSADVPAASACSTALAVPQIRYCGLLFNPEMRGIVGHIGEDGDEWDAEAESRCRLSKRARLKFGTTETTMLGWRSSPELGQQFDLGRVIGANDGMHDGEKKFGTEGPAFGEG